MSRPSGRFLVVDDHPDTADVLALLLVVSGHKASAARSGAEALERLRADAFDAVILDVEMPRMSGIEVARRVRAEAATAGLLVVFHTGVEEATVQLGFADYDLFLAKSIDPAHLLEAIERLLEDRPRPASGQLDQRKREMEARSLVNR